MFYSAAEVLGLSPTSTWPVMTAPSAMTSRGATMSPTTEPVARTSSCSLALTCPVTAPLIVTFFATKSAVIVALGPTVKLWSPSSIDPSTWPSIVKSSVLMTLPSTRTDLPIHPARRRSLGGALGSVASSGRTRSPVLCDPPGSNWTAEWRCPGCLNNLISSTRPVREIPRTWRRREMDLTRSAGHDGPLPQCKPPARPGTCRSVPRLRTSSRDGCARRGGWTGLQEYTRFTDVHGEATLPIIGAHDSIQRGDFPAVPRGTNGTFRTIEMVNQKLHHTTAGAYTEVSGTGRPSDAWAIDARRSSASRIPDQG